MERLSSEILHTIFIQIPLDERLECSLVCRRWHTIINERSLLFDLEIHTENMFDNLMTMIQHHPSRGLQTESLIITVNLEEKFDCVELRGMFPNLRVFKYKGRRNAMGRFPIPSDEDDMPDIAVVEQALPTLNSWNKLRQLVLSTGPSAPRKTVYPFLKDMPLLKELTLRGFIIGIQDCETIHHNLPAIEEFKLKNIALDANPLPSDIVPATSVTSFYLYTNNIVYSHEYPNWYKYLAKKYTHLESFFCSDELLPIASLDQRLEIYQEGFIPIYARLGHRLSSIIASGVPAEVNLFQKLSDFGCQLKGCYLGYCWNNPLFTQLVQSSQAKHIQHLMIENTAIDSPRLFQDMTMLTKLGIDIARAELDWPIDLTGCLNTFPSSLTDFSVKCDNLRINRALDISVNNIEKLSIACDVLTKDLFHIISTSFPKLVNLSLRGHVHDFLDLNLPTFNLDSLEIYAYREDELPGFIVEFMNDDRIDCYLAQFLDDGSILVDRVMMEELLSRITIKIICASIKALILKS